MPQPILGNQTVELASKGFSQGIAKAFDQAIGSPDFLLFLAVLGVLIIAFTLMRRRH